jgi:hypothetical protein
MIKEKVQIQVIRLIWKIKGQTVLNHDLKD